MVSYYSVDEWNLDITKSMELDILHTTGCGILEPHEQNVHYLSLPVFTGVMTIPSPLAAES